MNTRYMIHLPIIGNSVSFVVAIWSQPIDGGTGFEKSFYSSEQVEVYRDAFNSTKNIYTTGNFETDKKLYSDFVDRVEIKFLNAEFDKCRDNPVYFINNYTKYGIENPIPEFKADLINNFIKQLNNDNSKTSQD